MYDFVIVGAAQAGLSIAYYLKEQNKNFLLVDKESEIGASWLNRWDSLTLFTPTEFNHLPGMPFPAAKGHYPSKTEVAAYFKAYTKKFDFPVQLNTLVKNVKRTDNGFVLKTNTEHIEARQLIIGTGPFHIPYTPQFATNLSDSVFQIHSNFYKNPDQLNSGPALVVGGGDSGYQILDEISASGRKTYFSGATDVKVLPQEILGRTLWWWFTKTGYLSFSRNSWVGRRISERHQPIIGTDVSEILGRKNVKAVGKTLNAFNNTLVAEEGKLTDIKNVIWATGYRPNFSWIDDLQLGKDGYPIHTRGISDMEGLYFIGLPWLHTRGSATLGGIKKDAQYLAQYIAKTSGTL